MTMTTQKFVVIMNSSFGLWKQQLLMTIWQDKVFDIVDEMNLTLITNKIFYSTQYNKEITHMDWTKFLKKTIKRNHASLENRVIEEANQIIKDKIKSSNSWGCWLIPHKPADPLTNHNIIYIKKKESIS